MFAEERPHPFMQHGRGWRGPWDFGPWMEGARERRFEKGDLKYVVLDMLGDKPRHGYEIIQEIEERSHGFYAPSPGSVYPILQMLEDLGYVVSEAQAGRKTYSLTDEGRKYLDENGATVKGIWERAGGGAEGFPFAENMRDLMHDLKYEFRDLFRLFGRHAFQRRLTPDKVARMRDVMSSARKELEKILSE